MTKLFKMMKIIPEHNILATDQWFIELTNDMWCFSNFDISRSIFWTSDNNILCEKDYVNKIIWFNKDIWNRFYSKYNLNFSKTQSRLNVLVENFNWVGYKCYCNITDIEDRWTDVRIPEIVHI